MKKEIDKNFEIQFKHQLGKSKSNNIFNLRNSTRKIKTIYLNKILTNTFSSSRTLNISNKNIYKDLLPKINKSSSSINLINNKPSTHFVLPEFKPQAQIIGEKLNQLNIKFNKIRQPSKEINIEQLYIKKQKKGFEIKNLHKYEIYKKSFSKLFFQIKRINDN